MDWTMVGALGELLGAIAVVVSLIYLAKQVRANTLEHKRTRMTEISSQATTFPNSFAHDPDWADIVFRGFQDRDKLTPQEAMRFYGGLLGMFRAWESLVHYELEGGVHEWGAATFRRTMLDLAALPGIRAYWRDRRHWYSEEFAAEVDDTMARASGRMLEDYTPDDALPDGDT